MKKIIAITIVALTLIATVLAACAEKEPVGPAHIMTLATTSADERYRYGVLTEARYSSNRMTGFVFVPRTEAREKS